MKVGSSEPPCRGRLQTATSCCGQKPWWCCVIKRIEAEEKTSGGIIIPDTAKEKPQEGEVVAVGPGGRDEAGKLIPIDLKAGDRVLFGKWSGTEVKIDGVDYLVMKESDVMGVLTETDARRKAA
jgi:chaperonin GroES